MLSIMYFTLIYTSLTHFLIFHFSFISLFIVCKRQSINYYNSDFFVLKYCVYCHLVKILNIKHLTLEKVQMSSVTTRSSKSCVILEMVSCLQENNLPTINNVLGYILYVEKEKSNNTKTLNADLRFAAIDEVVNKVLYIWKKASIPTASKQQSHICRTKII